MQVIWMLSGNKGLQFNNYGLDPTLIKIQSQNIHWLQKQQ